MRKKKLGVFLLAAAMLVMLTACGENAPNSTQSSSDAGKSVPSSSSQTVDLTGGSEMESAQDVPLDTNMQGKIPKGEKQWFSFTTDETENAVYKITQVNQTPETGNLCLCVYDAEENKMHSSTLEAGSSGKAETLSLELLPETTYYIQMWAKEEDVIHYSLILRSPEGAKPENNVAQSGPEPTDGMEIQAAANQASAELLPLNVKMKGKVSNGKGQWYAFSTNSVENATYKLPLVNMTAGTDKLCMSVYNMFGERVNKSQLEAFQNGKAATLSLELPPDTTYYIYIWPVDQGETIEYTLTICAEEDTDSRN